MAFQGILPLVLPAALMLMGWLFYKSCNQASPDVEEMPETASLNASSSEGSHSVVEKSAPVEISPKRMSVQERVTEEDAVETSESLAHVEKMQRLESERLKELKMAEEMQCLKQLDRVQELQHLELEHLKELKIAEEMECLEELDRLEFEHLEEFSQSDGELMMVPASTDIREHDGFKDYDCLALLGRGAFGKVLLAESKVTKVLVVIKVLKKREIVDNENVDSLLCERRVLETVSRIRHPFLVSFFGCFQTIQHICLIMEFAAGGDLTIDPENPFSECRAVLRTACVVLGLEGLHEQNIAHRDLKPKNLLLDSRGFVKIADFGLSKEGMGVTTRTSTFCGTPQFFAPEMMTGDSYTWAVDWWALGVLLFEMMVGECPFTGDSLMDLYTSIVNDPVPFPQWMSVEAISIMTRLMSKNPEWRLGAGERGAEDVKGHSFFRSVDCRGLREQTVTPPFVPTVNGHEDVGSSEAPVLTLGSRVFSPEEQDLFRDFEFVVNGC